MYTANNIINPLVSGISSTTTNDLQYYPQGQVTLNAVIQPSYGSYNTVQLSTPHGCNYYADGNKLVVITVRKFEDIKLMTAAQWDIFYCLDTKQYWRCIDLGIDNTLQKGILNQITPSKDQPVFKQVILTENLEVVEVVEPVKIEELNTESKELYDAFEKVLNLKSIETKRPDTAQEKFSWSSAIGSFLNPPEKHLGVPC